MKEFFNKQTEYFWEYEYPFGEVFLKNIFKDAYKRKYSMTGEGIFNLVTIDDKIYEIKFKETRLMVKNDGKKATRDSGKDIVVEKICEALAENGCGYAVNSGKFITFKINDKHIAKIEVIKKLKMPQ